MINKNEFCKIQTEKHPLSPFFPKNAKILMLGSFPPPKIRWKMNFFYPNLQNDMWRIFGLVFFDDKNYFLAKDLKSFNEPLIRSFLAKRAIALWDTAIEARRLSGNASDKFLEVVCPINLKAALKKLTECKTIALTGQKASDILFGIVGAKEPNIGSFAQVFYAERKLRIYRMPSSSRAYPKSVEEKSEIYAKMFKESGFLK
ncbi:MAG: uracil-DNA glycosylase family protein [Endomicrobium sp.]|jgi:G:T/U-mismatch repair DNA glycosylase|nr:uracil-DNA glycosylase family protein [Endomicrobium sp.]